MTAHRALAVLTALTAGALLSACSTTSGTGSTAASNVAHHAPASPSASSDRGVTDAPSSTGTPPQAPPTSSAPVTTTAPVTTAAPPPSSSAPVPQGRPQGQPQITNFVGTWYGHGRSLVVHQDGTIVFDFRTYRDCTATVTTACDRFEGNAIIDGGHVTGRITYIANDTTVTVTGVSSSDPGDFPTRPFRLGFDRAHDALAPFTGQFYGVPFCGDRAPDGYCGA